MKFPKNTPKLLVDTLENNSFLLSLSEELVEDFFQVKAWKTYIRGNNLGIQVSLSFHTSDGVGIDPFPVFPDKGTEEYETLRKQVISFGGFINLKAEDLSEDQFRVLRVLSSLEKEDSSPIQLYGNMVVKFKTKTYTKEGGIEEEILEIRVFPDLATFQVGKPQTYEALLNKAGELPPTLFRKG
jgi:hypothetical protein